MRRHLAASTLLLGLAACATPEAKQPNTTLPLHEQRALSVIAQTYKDFGITPGEGRTVRLASGRSLRVDVTIAGHRYGVAYLTATDQAALDAKADLPPHTPGGDLPVVQGAGADADAVILVLLAQDYEADDFRGAGREVSGITAERKLARDVRDFLTQARLRKLP
jgi:ABC-type uncharacterized transport system auxiliary subunit